MFLKTQYGYREMFSAAFDSSVPIPRPSQWGGSMSYSGKRVTYAEAVGLPAFHRAVRLICETSASMPIMLSRGQGGEAEPQPEAQQAEVLRRPNPDMTAFQVWSYVYACMIRGNAVLWKVKVRGQVKYLYPLRPDLVTIKRQGGEVIFEIRKQPMGPVDRTVTTEDVIHIPGCLLDDPVIGVSLVTLHRNTLGTAMGRQEFEGRYLANDGQPGIVLKHTEFPTPDQRKEMRDSFESRHGGVGNAGRPAMMWGGWDIDRIAVSLEDAEFIAGARYMVQDIARMTGVPSGLLDEPPIKSVATTPVNENMRFSTYGLGPWQTRLGQGLAADTDLFPEFDWNVRHDHSELLKPDIKTLNESDRTSRQGGWITANEIRKQRGLPERADGDTLQETPVGGAPNSEASTEPTEPTKVPA